MNPTEIIERLVLDLMVKGAIDQSEQASVFAQLRSGLMEQKEAKPLLQILQTIWFEPIEKGKGDLAFRTALQTLETLSELIKAGPARAAMELPSELGYDRKADAAVLSSLNEEVSEKLEALEHDLLLLERSPESSTMMTQVMGRLHSIKGIAGFVEARALQKLAHIAESALQRDAQCGHARKETCEAIFRTVDMMDRLLDMLNEHAQNPGRSFPALPPTYAILIGELNDLSLSGDAGINLDESPGVEPIQQESEAGEATHVFLSSTETELIEDNEGDDELYEEIDLEEDSSEIFGNLVLDGLEPSAEVPESQRQASSRVLDLSEQVRVKMSRIEELTDLIGELMIAQARLVNDDRIRNLGDIDLGHKLKQLGTCTRSIQRVGMSMRLFPVNTIFRPLMRTVRDLASRQMKNVDLVFEGEDTEMDKSILQGLSEPLVHVVRNAVDHGMESISERRLAGKAKFGQIKVSARLKGSGVEIEVSDDGHGLNTERILEKARERGLVGPLEQPEETEIHQLIFAPSFSTAEELSDISGRGVGMDVVKRCIERMGGTASVRSQAGQGTTITFSLPLTLAMMDVLAVTVNQQVCLIPKDFAAEALRPRHDQIDTLHGNEHILSIRGTQVPLIFLCEFLHRDAKHGHPCEHHVVLLRNLDRTFGLVVDTVVGQQQVMLKTLGEIMAKQNGIIGCAILQDGGVGMILDPKEVAEVVCDRLGLQVLSVQTMELMEDQGVRA